MIHWDRGANYDGPACETGVGFSTSNSEDVTCDKCVVLIRRADSGYCVPCQRGLCDDCTGKNCACFNKKCDAATRNGLWDLVLTLDGRVDELASKIETLESEIDNLRDSVDNLSDSLSSHQHSVEVY